MTRVVAGARLVDDPAKEILRRQLWMVAEFCGVEILTYAILRNHFHILVRVPQIGNGTTPKEYGSPGGSPSSAVTHHGIEPLSEWHQADVFTS